MLDTWKVDVWETAVANLHQVRMREGTTGHTTECTSDSPPLAVALGIFPVPFHVTKTDWQQLVLKYKSETAGIKLPWQLSHCLSTVKPLFKRWVHNCSTSWVRSRNYKPWTVKVHKSPKAISILSQMNTIHILILQVPLKCILSSLSSSSKRCLLLRVVFLLCPITSSSFLWY
jgi:hypothetical protein